MGSEAIREGQLTPYQLRSRFQSVYPGVYGPKHSTPSLRQRSEAAWLWSGRRGVICGLAASALHGSAWIDDEVPVELMWRNPHPPAGMVTRNHSIRDYEVTRIAGLAVTTEARTAFDLGRLMSRGRSLARLDALMRASPFSAHDVRRVIEAHPGSRGMRQLRAVLPLVDGGAASPK